ncbi:MULTISPECIES: histidine phosphatase family protein [unclassified Minwuia]|jgi:broad specificity phosphatase PhoE|uniref:histidine phosphatase family protein n=1 Tax=unclassified Minwuia TaxID=2618799 RepID=UPI00247A9B4D|nr:MULTISPECIES: histidine phosphatase family protein [unclassified Minwuia]
MNMFNRLAALLLAVGLTLPLGARAADEAALWQAAREGEAIIIMRHALAPGVGDPAEFDVTDCTTQRNLDAAGRAQSRGIGERFRAAGISSATVYSSAWCRCRETAELLGLGDVTILPALNSFFREWERQEAQIDDLRAWLTEWEGDGPLVLVSHQVNIRALTGQSTRSGEMLFMRVAKDGTIEVLGSI